MDILDRIKALVIDKGMSIAELERKSDISNGTIARWNKHLPSGDKLQRVAKTLGTTIDYLVNGEDDSELSEKSKILARNAEDLTEEQLALIQEMIKQFKK